MDVKDRFSKILIGGAAAREKKCPVTVATGQVSMWVRTGGRWTDHPAARRVKTGAREWTGKRAGQQRNA